VALFCASISLAIAAVILVLPEPAPTLAPEASAGLPIVGVGNPVTAVLLSYRAFDTFLEKIVLVLALVGVWSLAADRDWGGAPVVWRYTDPDGVLKFLAQMLAPIGVLIAIYMLWTGADHPGGAFQASAMLAAMWMLTMAGGLMRLPQTDNDRLRLTLVSGAAAFLLLGLAGFGISGSFLAYPPDYAKALIVAVEIPMTIAVAATLVMLVAGPSQRRG
jgi:multisubunit Na+/H+ antiporter MnhB subunit